MNEPFDRTLSDKALQDLANIYEYVAEKNPAAANLLIDAIIEKIDSLATSRNSGVARDSLSSGLRAFPFKQRCIYFRIVGNELRVLRVLHGKQDVTAEQFKD